MPLKDQEWELCQQCDALFNTLNRSFLNQLAFYLSWSMDDLRQEFRLVFWEINSGANSGTRGYHVLKGDIPGYFVGRLRNLIRGGIALNFATSLNSSEFDEDAQPLHPSVHEAVNEKSVLDVLIGREDQIEADQIAQGIEDNIENLRVHFSANKRAQRDWIWRLWHQGLSQTQIARAGGVSQSFVSRFLNKKTVIKKLTRVCNSQINAMKMEQGVLF